MAPVTVRARARARVNWGRWIADCPELYCNNAEDLTPGQATFHCTVCRIVGPVEWPADADGIWSALLERPRPATRNWYPAGHDEAVRLGLPHGQSARALDDETREHQGD